MVDLAGSGQWSDSMVFYVFSSLDDAVILIHQLLGSPDPNPTHTVLCHSVREKYQGHDPAVEPKACSDLVFLVPRALCTDSDFIPVFRHHMGTPRVTD